MVVSVLGILGMRGSGIRLPVGMKVRIHQFDSSILSAPFIGLVIGDWPVLPEAGHRQPLRIDVLRNQGIRHGLRAGYGESSVGLRISLEVGVALHTDVRNRTA